MKYEIFDKLEEWGKTRGIATASEICEALLADMQAKAINDYGEPTIHGDQGVKLRNKKTGKIGTLIGTERSCPFITIGVDFHDGNPRAYDYKTLDQLNEEWEDYKPAEPYIKDEKVRKFVRDWAKHWKIDKVVIRFIDNDKIDLIGFPSSTGTGREIDIQRTVVRNEIIYGKRYTIDELCGEEEECEK